MIHFVLAQCEFLYDEIASTPDYQNDKHDRLLAYLVCTLCGGL